MYRITSVGREERENITNESEMNESEMNESEMNESEMNESEMNEVKTIKIFLIVFQFYD